MSEFKLPIYGFVKRIGHFCGVAVTLSVALCLAGMPVGAQSPTILLGNPQTTTGAAAQGYTVTASVSQTPSATNITYNVAPPSSGAIVPQLLVGRIVMQTVLPSGAEGTSATTNVSYSGDINVVAVGGAGPAFPSTGFGSQAMSPSPQSFTGLLQRGTSVLVFSLGSQANVPSTITVSIGVGNSTGAHKPYLDDFDGNGATDLSVWRPSEGNWYVNFNNAAPIRVDQWGLPGDIPVAGDFDGDGLSDRAVWRPSEGNWYITLSSTGQQFVRQFGLSGDVPLVADFDADGKTDFTVWRPSNGTWYVLLSSTGQFTQTQWGLSGDIPVAADFDGDGKADFAIWRPGEANWYVIPSTDGIAAVIQQGTPGDIPVVADYDGDGKADLALWTPSSGVWSIRHSTNGQITLVQWGLSGDVPVPGDYDGDGRADYVVWRPSGGNWYLYETAVGQQGPVQWGLSGDTPVGQLVIPQ